MDDDDLDLLARQVGERLLSQGRRVACAESCTGGWLTKVLTDVPGASKSLDRGWIVYSDAAKRALGVARETLERHGAVSEEVVVELARCALRESDADVAVAISGVAGPDGGTPEKPVGLVWFAWADRDGQVRASGHRFPGDREAVRRASVVTALNGLLAL